MSKLLVRIEDETSVETLECSDEAVTTLDRLQRDSKVTSRIEVVRDALRLYDWYLKQKTAGRRFQVVDSNGRAHGIQLVLDVPEPKAN